MELRRDSDGWMEQLLNSAAAMQASGKLIVARLVDGDAPAEQWQRYPADDVVNGTMHARYFYHCHPPGEREGDEHGHFHLFIDRAAMPAHMAPLIAAPSTSAVRADVVHIVALAIDYHGLPLRWFTVNRWVTDESTYPASAIVALLGQISFAGEQGDALVNQWLDALFQLCRSTIVRLLEERDTKLLMLDMSGENREVEVMSSAVVELPD